MEQFCSFVSSRGLLRSCSAHALAPVSSSPVLDVESLLRLRHTGSLYLCTDALPAFVDQVLDQVSGPFTLVTGDSDTPVAAASLGAQRLARLLESPNLVRWFAQNCCVEHPKLHPMPIGLDYHTMRLEAPTFLGFGPRSPLAQEGDLTELVRASRPLERRRPQAYCNWHFQPDRGDRRECMADADPAAMYYEPRPVPRLSSWRHQVEFAFVASPWGGGLDCHRTWEAIATGCIPIVRRSPLDRLMRGLPVLLVDDWREVTADRLAREHERLARQRFDFTPMLLEHWRALVADRPGERLPAMTVSEWLDGLR